MECFHFLVCFLSFDFVLVNVTRTESVLGSIEIKSEIPKILIQNCSTENADSVRIEREKITGDSVIFKLKPWSGLLYRMKNTFMRI